MNDPRVRDLTPAQRSQFADGYARMMRQIMAAQPKVEVAIKEKKAKPGPSPLRQVTQGTRKSMRGGKSRIRRRKSRR